MCRRKRPPADRPRFDGLVALDASAAPDLTEGDWVALDYDLPSAAQASGLSQYELLTGLSERLERRWI